MPAVEAVSAPLRDVAAQLQHVAVALGFELAVTGRRAFMTAGVTHPHAGGVVGVLRFAEAIVQAVVKQRVGRRDIADIAACFRAQGIRGSRVDDRWFDRIDWRYRIVRRCHTAGPFTGQIPVFRRIPGAFGESINIRPGFDSPGGQGKVTGRITADLNHFDTVHCLCAGAANIVYLNPGVARRVAVNRQFIR